MTTTVCPVDAGFDPLGADYLDDPYPLLAQAREQTPVFHAPAIDMWVVTRYDDIEAIFRDPSRFSAAIAQSPLSPLAPEATEILRHGFGASPTMSNCDPPRHARIRTHAAKAFSPRRIAVLEPVIRERVAKLLGAVEAEGRADLVSALSFPLPAVTIFTLVGFPDEDTELLKSWCGDRMSFTWGRPSADFQAEVARNMVAYWGYCERFVRRRLQDLGDDYTSDLLRIHLADPEALSVDEITNIVYGLSFAGHETTTNLITNTIRSLLEHPPQWDSLCADPSLIPAAVEEGLRYDTSVITWRRITTEAVTIGGVPVPAGAKLLLLLGAAGRDPAHYPEPDRFDVHRPNARTHLAFGKGIHFCLGAALARMQVAIVLEHLTTVLPSLRLVPDQSLVFSPNVAFRGPAAFLVEWDLPALRPSPVHR